MLPKLCPHCQLFLPAAHRCGRELAMIEAPHRSNRIAALGTGLVTVAAIVTVIAVSLMATLEVMAALQLAAVALVVGGIGAQLHERHTAPAPRLPAVRVINRR
jgi:hypothetical protein